MMTEKEYAQLEERAKKSYDCTKEWHGYTCKQCGMITPTTARHRGVTPFVITCKCGGIATHTITENTAPLNSLFILTARYFVRPTYKQYCKLSKSSREHVENCGLLFEDELPNK